MLTPLALLLACHAPGVQVVDARELGSLEQSAWITGRDGGYAGPAFGQDVWLYGDTILSVENEDGATWCNNTASWTADLDASDGLTDFTDWADGRGVPVEFLPRTDEEAAFNAAHEGDDCAEEPCGARWALWPAALVADEPRERALVFYHLIYAEPGEWNFSAAGGGIATWGGLDLAPERPEVSPGAEHPTLLFQAGEPELGAAALVEGDDLYAFACEGGYAKPCVLGRVPLSDALDRGAWAFWDGGGWSAEVGAAEALFDAHTMLSVQHLAAFDLYIALYNRPMDDRVYLRSAPALTGPWSRDEAVFVAEPSWDGAAAYGAMAHPELDRGDGRFIYLTYFRSPADWEGEIRLVELELSAR
ncbi:MAG: DUF4185 domain-containing protein [Pseudomonadota bacterium]